MCLKDLRDEFVYDCECRHLAKGSLRNYKAATRFLLEYLELKQITELEDVRPRHIRDLMKEKQDAGSTSRYINDLLKVWRTWFNYLVNEGYLEERDNPAKKVKCLRQPRTIIDTFTAAEMKRMIQFYDGKDFLEVRNKTIIMLLFDTGMRCNEMIMMEPEDIKQDYILVKHGKGSKERVVPKSPALSKQLVKYCTLRDGYLKERPSQPVPERDRRRNSRPWMPGGSCSGLLWARADFCRQWACRFLSLQLAGGLRPRQSASGLVIE